MPYSKTLADLEAFAKNSNCRIVGDMAGSRYAFEHCLTLPLFHDMTDSEQRYVTEHLLDLLGDKRFA